LASVSPLDEARERTAPDPRTVLERFLVPELLQALERYIAEAVAEEFAARRPEPDLLALKPWLTAKEAAELLGCSAKAVRARCKRGRLEHRYMGRRLYVSTASIRNLG
jgi:DNA-directed RNA polymerase specialized sigma24 family protein